MPSRKPFLFPSPFFGFRALTLKLAQKSKGIEQAGRNRLDGGEAFIGPSCNRSLVSGTVGNPAGLHSAGVGATPASPIWPRRRAARTRQARYSCSGAGCSRRRTHACGLAQRERVDLHLADLNRLKKTFCRSTLISTLY